MSSMALDRVLHALLGPPGRQRSCVRQSLLVLALYLICAVVQHAEVMLGLIELRASNRLTLFNLSGAMGFVLIMRSGLNQRWTKDPSLTVLQCGFGILGLSFSYAITGAARGAVMSLVMLILVFSMFTLAVRDVVRLGVFAFGMLAAAMVWKAHADPLRYPPPVEVIHFVLAFVVIMSIGLLSARMTTLRSRLHRKKAELECAVEKIRLLATKDELTGLVNRRHMSELMQAEQARITRGGAAMSLVLMDIDHFKQINDRLGHKAGDEVLRRFGGVAAEALRASDVLSRWGGEEFLLMLPATSACDAMECVERLRSAWDATPLDAVHPGLRVTFSAGISGCLPGAALEAAIECADRAMYGAKEAGRNRTVMARAPVPQASRSVA